MYVKKMKRPVTDWRKYLQIKYLIKAFFGGSKKVKYTPIVLPSHSTARYLSKGKGISAHTKTWIQMITAVLFVIAPS